MSNLTLWAILMTISCVSLCAGAALLVVTTNLWWAVLLLPGLIVAGLMSL